MRLETKVTVDVDTDELAESLPRDSIFDMIVDLDEAVGSWDFTLKLAEHFENLKKRYEQESHVHDFEDDGWCDCGETLKIVS
jgi:hypothetical protein